MQFLCNTRHICRFAVIGLLVVIAIFLISLPRGCKTTGDRMNATEVLAIREIKVLQQAQAQYIARFNKYASTLAELGPPSSGKPGPKAADLIPASLASGDKDGYLFTLKLTQQGYAINANPKVYPTLGQRTFYSDQTMVIRQNWAAEPANVSSPALK